MATRGLSGRSVALADHPDVRVASGEDVEKPLDVLVAADVLIHVLEPELLPLSELHRLSDRQIEQHLDVTSGQTEKEFEKGRFDDQLE